MTDVTSPAGTIRLGGVRPDAMRMQYSPVRAIATAGMVTGLNWWERAR